MTQIAGAFSNTIIGSNKAEKRRIFFLASVGRDGRQGDPYHLLRIR
jgi:hypothetical protein